MAPAPDDACDREPVYLRAEGTNDVVWTMSATGEITSVSPSVERMRGMTPEEARQQSLEQIHPPESAAISTGYSRDLYAALAEGRAPPGVFRGELEYYCADGSTVWTEVHVMPRYGPGGELVAIMGVARDISERRAHEHAMRRARADAHGGARAHRPRPARRPPAGAVGGGHGERHGRDARELRRPRPRPRGAGPLP